jgi:hypothetical protein
MLKPQYRQKDKIFLKSLGRGWGAAQWCITLSMLEAWGSILIPFLIFKKFFSL